MWPTGLGEQSEHWILVPPTSARLLVPCIHITGTVDSAISHWNSQDVTALMNSPVVSSYKGANYYIISLFPHRIIRNKKYIHAQKEVSRDV